MNEATPAERRPARRRRLGCLPALVLVIVVVAGIVVAIGFIFDQGDSAKQPRRRYDAGPASAFPAASVNYVEPEHLYVVRLQDGGFIALYDKSAKQQELGGDCRVTYDETAGVGTLDQLPGMTGGFVEDCNSSRSVWRADGTFAFGSSYGNLDRYDTTVGADGHLVVDTRSRSCTRSRGVIGVPPFDVQRCGTGS